MKLNDYQELSKRTLPEYNVWDNKREALANYGLGICGESAEVADHIKKIVFHGHPIHIYEIAEELGDTLHYVAGLATMLGLNLSDIAEGNVNKLLKRYPKGFNSEDSIKRVDTKK